MVSALGGNEDIFDLVGHIDLSVRFQAIEESQLVVGLHLLGDPTDPAAYSSAVVHVGALL